jgi:hypothetical protein
VRAGPAGERHRHHGRPPDGRPQRRAFRGDPEAPIGLFEYLAITQYPTDLFPVRVDIANRRSLKPLVRPSAEREAVYAF